MRSPHIVHECQCFRRMCGRATIFLPNGKINCADVTIFSGCRPWLTAFRRTIIWAML